MWHHVGHLTLVWIQDRWRWYNRRRHYHRDFQLGSKRSEENLWSATFLVQTLPQGLDPRNFKVRISRVSYHCHFCTVVTLVWNWNSIHLYIFKGDAHVVRRIHHTQQRKSWGHSKLKEYTYERPIESWVVQSQGGLLYGSPCDHRIRAQCAPQKQGA